MSIAEIEEWMILERIEPFGEAADWLRHGIATALQANIHRDKDTSPFKPSDFMPVVEEPKVQTPEDMFHFMKMLQAAQQQAIRKAERGQTEGNA